MTFPVRPKLTTEEFNTLWNINSSGDYDFTKNQVENNIGKVTWEGNSLTFELIKEKYTKYYNWWIQQHGDTETKYLRKENELRTICDWLNKDMWNNDPKLHKNRIRDQYLFGPYTKEYLRERIDKFKKTFIIL